MTPHAYAKPTPAELEAMDAYDRRQTLAEYVYVHGWDAYANRLAVANARSAGLSLVTVTEEADEDVEALEAGAP